MKKWIAHSEGFAKGELHLNRQAVEAVRGVKATSILPVGVTRVVGDFEKDDLVRVMDEQGRQIGVGRVSADSAEALSMVAVYQPTRQKHFPWWDSTGRNRWYITIICIWNKPEWLTPSVRCVVLLRTVWTEG